MIKVGIMGGAFDPIHIGHMLAAETAREACGLDEIWFIPSAASPLKESGPAVSGAYRLEMVRQAVLDMPYCQVLELELARGGVSYSIDTVHTLMDAYPNRTFSYIIGADRINDLYSWHRITELAALVSFIGLERPGYPIDRSKLPKDIASKLRVVTMPQLELSSSDIRARREAGRSIRFMVPDNVYHYIVRNDLYGSR